LPRNPRRKAPIKELPRDGAGEIAIRLLDQQQITVLADVAQISELVLVVTYAFDLARVCVKLSRLPDQIEAHIGQRHVLFQHRRMATPFRHTMAEDQRIVGAAQRVKHKRAFFDDDRCSGHDVDVLNSIPFVIASAAKQTKAGLLRRYAPRK
jgi:hypothetical protein